jgi:hypothetical protein
VGPATRVTGVIGVTRVTRVALLSALGLVASCDGAPTSPDGRMHAAQLAVAITLQSEPGAGGEGDAYDAANVVRIRLVQDGGTVLFDRTTAFEPEAETHVPISVQIQDETAARLDITLLQGTSPLFTGTASLTLLPNEVVPADLTLVPVAASISVPESLATLVSLGETLDLPGSVLFATGDVASSLHLQWTSLTPDVVAVQTDGSVSAVVAVGSGEGRLRASFPPFESTVLVAVDIVAATVEVEPATGTVGVGETLQLTATARDALGNPLPETAPTWSSSDEAVASVDDSGVVSGVTRGTSTIQAAVGEATGEATIEVVAPRPSVGTDPASDVSVFTATLNATVSAKGSPATAWFRYGTDATLATASETPHEDIGSGDDEQSFSAEVDGLEPETTYWFRAVASNDGGEREGEIESFTTRALAPPSVATLTPSPVASTTARLVGTVDPNGTNTVAHFEWGTSPSLSTFVSTPDEELGGEMGETEIQRTITDLDPDGRTYYFRVVATNEAGTSESDVRSFRTAPASPSGFSADPDGPTVYMSWTNNSSIATYVSVERSAASASGSFTQIGTVTVSSEGGEYAEDDAPFPGKTLWYRVRACDAFGCSEPSNVEMVTVSDPVIYGYVCFEGYPPEACYGPPSVTVQLIGLSEPITTTSDAFGYGFWTFGSVPVGTYAVRVDDIACSLDFTPNQQTVEVGWGEAARVVFYADTIFCEVPEGASSGPDPFHPVVSALLGLDADGASDGAAPR